MGGLADRKDLEWVGVRGVDFEKWGIDFRGLEWWVLRNGVVDLGGWVVGFEEWGGG